MPTEKVLPVFHFHHNRVVLRHLVDSDLDDMVLIFGNPNVAKWMGNGIALTREQCLKWIYKSQDNYQKLGYGAFAVVDTSTGRMVGCGGIVHPDGQPDCEIIYALKETYWGQGLGKDMIAAILTCGTTRYGISRIKATVDPDNSASIQLLVSQGMRYVDTQPDEDGFPTATYIMEAGQK